jgi:hypothetical protein
MNKVSHWVNKRVRSEQEYASVEKRDQNKILCPHHRKLPTIRKIQHM